MGGWNSTDHKVHTFFTHFYIFEQEYLTTMLESQTKINACFMFQLQIVWFCVSASGCVVSRTAMSSKKKTVEKSDTIKRITTGMISHVISQIFGSVKRNCLCKSASRFTRCLYNFFISFCFGLNFLTLTDNFALLTYMHQVTFLFLRKELCSLFNFFHKINLQK